VLPRNNLKLWVRVDFRSHKIMGFLRRSVVLWGSSRWEISSYVSPQQGFKVPISSWGRCSCGLLGLSSIRRTCCFVDNFGVRERRWGWKPGSDAEHSYRSCMTLFLVFVFTPLGSDYGQRVPVAAKTKYWSCVPFNVCTWITEWCFGPNGALAKTDPWMT